MFALSWSWYGMWWLSLCFGDCLVTAVVDFYTYLHSVCSVGYTGTRFVFGGRTAVNEASGAGIEFAPDLSEVFGRLLSPYRTFPNTPVGSYRASTPGMLWNVPYQTHYFMCLEY